MKLYDRKLPATAKVRLFAALADIELERVPVDSPVARTRSRHCPR